LNIKGGFGARRNLRGKNLERPGLKGNYALKMAQLKGGTTGNIDEERVERG